MTKRDELIAERAELIAKIRAATGWGAAVGARYERIKEIDGQLARLSALEAPAAGDGEPVARKRPVAFRVRQHRLSNHYELYTNEKDAQFWADDRGIEYEGLYLVADRFTAPPADAGMREALGAELSEIFERFLSAHEGDKVHLADVLRGWLWDNKAGLVAALTAPGATTKSDGDDCFWSQCSDRKRCAEYGSCVALAQRKAIAAGDFPSRPSDPSPTRSEVTVEELAAIIEREVVAVIHIGDENPEIDGKSAARALLETHEIRRK